MTPRVDFEQSRACMFHQIGRLQRPDHEPHPSVGRRVWEGFTDSCV